MLHHLEKRLGALSLWAIMVGMVISGQYFGWNYGIASGGLKGFIIATALVVLFYTGFIFTCAELASRYPKAGGPSEYVTQAFGPFCGFITGIACLIEFMFATPAIAVAIGHYLHFLCGFITPTAGALLALILVFWINLLRVNNIAVIEMVATVLALLGLLLAYLFAASVFWYHPVSHIDYHFFHTKTNVMAAIPFAIWLFLAMEGGAMSAEEVKKPKRNIPRGFVAALLTIIGCTFLTVIVSLVLGGSGIMMTDSPLPHALSHLPKNISAMASDTVGILGLFGLFASLNGITMAYSRQAYAMSLRGFMPNVFSRLSHNDVPYAALLIPGILVMLFAISASMTKVLVALSVFGAIIMYIFVLAAFFKLRKVSKSSTNFFVPKSLAAIAFVLALVFLVSVFFYTLLPTSVAFMGMHLEAVVLLLIVFVLAIMIYHASRWLRP